MHLLLKALLFIAAMYAAAMLALYFGQRKLMYHPDPTHVQPHTLGLDGFAEKVLTTPDKETVITWRAAARSGFPTLLYFHGNGGSLAGRGGRLQALQQAGFGIAIMSYRGYSGSTGSPSETANNTDARQLYDELRDQGISANDVIVYGESLGTGVATRLARDVDVAGLILDSPFTSIADRAAELYPWFPVRPFITDKYPVSNLISKINAPLLILHGEQDQVVPSYMGEAVFSAAVEPKTLKLFPNGNHVDLFNHGALAAIIEFGNDRD